VLQSNYLKIIFKDINSLIVQIKTKFLQEKIWRIVPTQSHS